MSDFNLPKALFLHIQKTGGTSIINIIKRYYKSLCSHGECWGHPASEFRDVRFVSSHLGYSYFEDFIKDRYSFTFLRDPIDRVISFYYFCKKRECPGEYEVYHLAQTLSFEQFLTAGFKDKLVKMYIWNNQTWQLACGFADPKGRWLDDFDPNDLLSLALEHATTFSRIGMTETLEEDAQLIAADLGLTDFALSKRSNTNSDRPRKEDLSPLELEMLHELTSLDRKLYIHVSKYRLDKKIKTYNP